MTVASNAGSSANAAMVKSMPWNLRPGGRLSQEGGTVVGTGARDVLAGMVTGTECLASASGY